MTLSRRESNGGRLTGVLAALAMDVCQGKAALVDACTPGESFPKKVENRLVTDVGARFAKGASVIPEINFRKTAVTLEKHILWASFNAIPAADTGLGKRFIGPGRPVLGGNGTAAAEKRPAGKRNWNSYPLTRRPRRPNEYLGHPDRKTIAADNSHGQNREQKNNQENKQAELVPLEVFRARLLWILWIAHKPTFFMCVLLN
jgi:hypothetical protein